MKEIIVATKNPGKAKEFKAFFSRFNIKCKSLLDIAPDYEDVPETGATFQENAIIKAKAASDYFKSPVIADDSGLVIDALDGKPGIETARFAGEDKNDDANMNKVLRLMKDVEDDGRTARFIAALAIQFPMGKTIVREGTCEGKIARSKQGTERFGYDPIFIPDGFDVTMAELSSEQKSKISHRNDAFRQLRKELLDI